ncbi:MAG: hypothetical protein QM734_08300 [Cyclobacteriaceae bacterium]
MLVLVLKRAIFKKISFDIKANFRKTYSSDFYDFNRQASLKIQESTSNTTAYVSDKPQAFNYYELGGTYHIKDFDQDSKTKMVLYKKSFKGDRWAATVPLPCGNSLQSEKNLWRKIRNNSLE